MNGSIVQTYLESIGIRVTPLYRHQIREIRQAWHRSFPINATRGRRKSAPGELYWYRFSCRFTPCLRGAEAEEAYRAVPDDAFLLTTSEDGAPTYQCFGRALFDPALVWLLLDQYPGVLDVYIYALDFHWTMVFTHEADCGPYFAEGRPDSAPSFPGLPGQDTNQA